MSAPLDSWLTDEVARRRTRAALIWSITLTVGLYLMPYGGLVGYPLVLLSTLVHEVGHGVAGVAVGGDFERFVMFADASGMARISGVPTGWRSAIVSAGGLVGPALAAGVAFVMARRPVWSRFFLALLAAAMLALVLTVVRNGFGLAFAGALALLFAGLGLRASAATAQVVAVFMAVQLSLSVFSRGDYLFVQTAHTGAGTAPSDVAQMASALGGPYWLWGLACGAFSVMVLVVGVWAFWRSLSRGQLKYRRRVG